MGFTPIVPFSGLAGWAFLQRTKQAQQTAFTSSAEVGRDVDYFRTNAASLTSAEDLVGDRRMLKVALGAFGLADDIDNRFFLTKVLAEGTLSADALANKLSDKRYAQFSRAFGFGDFATPRTQLSDFADEIVSAYEAKAFEEAVGQQSNDLRLAMNAQRELPAIAAGTQSADTKWYQIMASPPLREVFQTAFGLPSSFVSLDLDQQLSGFKDAAERYLGSADPSDLAATDVQDSLIRLFLARSDITATTAGTTAGATALALLRNAGTASLSLKL